MITTEYAQSAVRHRRDVKVTTRKTTVQSKDLVKPPIKKRRIIAKHVHFSEEASHTEHLSRRTDEDMRNAWYQACDQYRFRVDAGATLLALSKVNGDFAMLDPQVYTLRGFKIRTTPKKRRVHVQTIINQYRVQRELGRMDPLSIELNSVTSSREDRNDALKRGVQYASLD
jgi:hypothetical protein